MSGPPAAGPYASDLHALNAKRAKQKAWEAFGFGEARVSPGIQR